MEIFNSIAHRLLEVRESMGKTQSDFAAIAAAAGVPGATRQSQAKYEKGIAAPSAAYMAAIASAGADVLYILTGQHSQPVPDSAGLPPRVRALVANYEATDEDGKRVIESTASFAAQPVRSRRSGGR